MKAFYAALVLYASGSLAFASQTGDHNFVLIDRKKRSMSVVSESGKILVSCPVGIGRGPLKNKSNMQDCITPVGEFFIDVVLSDNPRFNDIAMAQKSQIAKNARFARLVQDAASCHAQRRTWRRLRQLCAAVNASMRFERCVRIHLARVQTSRRATRCSLR